MLKLLIYDIESDKIRTKIAKEAERKGLIRLQKSVWTGDMDKSKWKKFWQWVLEYTEGKLVSDDKIYCIIIEPNALRDMIKIGEQIDIDYICGTKLVEFI